jgi:hypothetical protein
MKLSEAPEPLRGHDTRRAGAELIKPAFPDARAEIDDIIAGEPARARRDQPARPQGGTLCTRRPAESMMWLILVSNASSAGSPWIEVRGHRVAIARPEARPPW